MAHDAITRWLAHEDKDPRDLWTHVQNFVDLKKGYLICDDTLIDKPYSKDSVLVKRQYSGKHHDIVRGICLVNILWTEGTQYIPVDYRIYSRDYDHTNKNEHFHSMLYTAHARGFTPRYILMDTWYSSLENLKYIRSLGWKFIATISSNRLVSCVQGIYLPVSDLTLEEGQIMTVWLKGFGFICVTKIVFTNGDIRFLISNDLDISSSDVLKGHFGHRWKVEEFHRGLKQTTGIERCSARRPASLRTHIFVSFVTFIRLEIRRLSSGLSWYESKASLSRPATASFIAS